MDKYTYMATTPFRLQLNGASDTYKAGDVLVLEGNTGASLLQTASPYYSKVRLIHTELDEVEELPPVRGQLVLDGLNNTIEPDANSEKEQVEANVEEQPFNVPNPEVKGPEPEPTEEATDIPPEADQTNLPEVLVEEPPAAKKKGPRRTTSSAEPVS